MIAKLTKKLGLWLTIILWTVISTVAPARAQTADCTEAGLRNKGVAIVNCAGDDTCDTSATGDAGSSGPTKDYSYTDASRSRTIGATVYTPGDGAAHPLIVFAPGFGQDSKSPFYARYLTAVAKQGFVVAGANFSNNSENPTLGGMVNDIKFLATKLLAEQDLSSKINAAAGVGLMGHSNGSVVVAAVAYDSTAKDSRIKAVILESGGVMSDANLDNPAGPPLLLTHGTADTINPIDRGGSQSVYDGAKTPYSAYAKFVGATHDDYITGAGGGGKFTSTMDELSGAFFKRFLSADGSDATKLVSVAGKTAGIVDFQQKGSDAPLGVPSSTTSTSGTSSSACCGTSGSSAIAGTAGSAGIMAFASQPLTSTWNISNSTVEQWYLKQGGVQGVIARYGVTSSNIGQITAVVKAAGVSPVFFYAYGVNEGGGAGGYINHYGVPGSQGSPLNGDMVHDAKEDADYLASHSIIMDSVPSWIDAGNPVDFVPHDIQNARNADFQKMPSGTIGRAYIPATAAATWEVYYPDGLKGSFNKVQDYGAPLADTMNSIKQMGGDPTQGGTTSGDCSNGVTGEGIAKSISWAKMIANNDGYGYDQDTRTTGWAKWQSDPNCMHECGNLDCSSFVAAALTAGGFFKTNPQFATGSEAAALAQAGFTKVASNPTTSANLQPGDILINTANHTAIYLGDDQIAEATHNESGGYHGGKPGDQKGDEIAIHTFYSYPWDDVWRAPK